MASKTSKIIADLRKAKDWSQSELANNSGVSREMIGKYERGEAVPSIDAAKKIADAFEVSMDYLIGEGSHASFDKKNIKRLQDIEKLDDDIKDKLYFVIDNIIQNSKAKKAYAL
jgi:transcriptional regulator with XRE-family HTH domain